MSNSTASSKPADAADAIDVAALLAEFDPSTQSAAAFAREHGLAPWKVYYALRRRSGMRRRVARGVNQALIPVRIVEDQATTPRVPVELVLAGGHRLLIPAEFDETALRRLVEVLAKC